MVGALIRRLDCREIGVVSWGELFHGVAAGLSVPAPVWLQRRPSHPPLPRPCPAPLQTSGLVLKLLHGCCFPAIAAMRFRASWISQIMAMGQTAGASAAQASRIAAASSGAADAAAVEAEAEAASQRMAATVMQQKLAQTSGQVHAQWERCIAAAREQAASGTAAASREVAFDLLLDLAVHDSGCWQLLQEQLSGVVHAPTTGAMFLPHVFNNVAPQLIRAPG